MDDVIRHLQRAVFPRDGADLADGQLLEWFLARRDEQAFEAMLRRHGPMVLAVCRRVLGNVHDAEDAFQATFLVFARKAAAVRPELLGHYLYGVAYRTSLKARAGNARRRLRERRAAERTRPQSSTEEHRTELLALLDHELNRLPDRYRAPLVLCELQGHSRKAAAQLLKIPEGTLSSRLATARKQLARRLARRGVALSAGLGTVLLPQMSSASLPPFLLSSTARAALLAAAGRSAAGVVSTEVIALAEGMVKTMIAAKLKVLAVVVCLLGLLGGAALAYRSADHPQAYKKREDAPRTEKKDGDRGKSDQDRIQGEWLLVAEEADGVAVPKDKLLPSLFVFRGDRFTVYKNGHEEARGAYKLDAAKAPKTLDLKGISHQGREASAEGIYKLESDTLTVAFGKKGRPKGFAPGAGDGVEVMTLRRQSPGSKEAAALMPDRDKIQGTWTVLSEEVDGKRLERKKDAKRLTFGGDKVTFRSKRGTIVFSFRLDPDEEPRCIDILAEEDGPAGFKGSISLKGVYKLEGDTLTINSVKGGQRRPRDFETKGKFCTLIILKRVPRDGEDK